MRLYLCLLICVVFSGCGQSTPDSSTPPIGFWRETGTHEYFGKRQTYVYFGQDHGYASEDNILMKSGNKIMGGVHYFDAWRIHDGVLELQMPSGKGILPGWSAAPFQWIDHDHMELRGTKYERVDRLKSEE